MVERHVSDKLDFKEAGEYEKAFAAFREPAEDELEEGKEGFHLHPDPLIEEYFHLVAYNGKTLMDWSAVKRIFLWKLKVVIGDMLKRKIDSTNEMDSPEYMEQMRDSIVSKCEEFEDAPFTIQRLCELLTAPTRHYNNPGKFLRAVEKTANVVTCVSPDGERVTKAEPEEEEPADEPTTRVENNFIVSVDEVDAPLEEKKAVEETKASEVAVPSAAGPQVEPLSKADENGQTDT